jgi:hypothetical protein
MITQIRLIDERQAMQVVQRRQIVLRLDTGGPKALSLRRHGAQEGRHGLAQPL